MRSKQTGVTLIGWIILLVPFAIVGYSGVRVMPLYLNYMKVARCLEQVKNDFKGDPGSAALLRTALEKHLNVESVDYPDVKDIKITRGDSRSWLLEAAYDDQAPLFQNLFIMVSFDKSVTLRGDGASD
jgi:hypothetical protein